jgi:hypothetical protein
MTLCGVIKPCRWRFNMEAFGLYELGIYTVADITLKKLKEEREMVVEALYDDITPTITSVDYDTGRWYSKTTHPETMALKIIDTKERYDALIDREARKTEMFQLGMESLTDRERDVIQVHYLGRKNNLGLSEAYFNQVLTKAQIKLCSYLGKKREKHRDEARKAYKTELAQRIAGWKI